MHQHLDSLLKLRRTCQQEGASGHAVQDLLRLSLLFVRDVMTEEVFRRAMKTGHDGEGLLLFANRVQLLQPLLADEWPSDFTFQEIVDELFGIANGDLPRLMLPRGKQGRFPNAHALLERKLGAHVWYKVLGRMGLKAPERQTLIHDAFGAPPETFNDWRKEARKKLSADYVERFLVTAVNVELVNAALQPEPREWAREQVIKAGSAYRAELRATSAVQRRK